jgi:hypothetical protein
MAMNNMPMPVKPEMEEMEMEGETEGAETPAVDLTTVSDEDLMAECKARGLC